MFEHSPQILASEEKATTTSEVLTKSGNMSIVSLEYMHNSKTVVRYCHDLVNVINNHTKFQLNWRRTQCFRQNCVTLMCP